MGNPSVKSFGNPQGKEFTMSESELVMTAKEGSLYISMNGSKWITLNSSTTVHIQSTDSLTLRGNEVHIEAIKGLNIITNTDTLDLVEDMNMKSSEITLRALKGYETTYPTILSEFEKQVAVKGIEQVKKERKSAAKEQKKKAYKDDAWGLVVGLGNLIKDAGDYAVTKFIQNVLSPPKNVLGIRTKEEAETSEMMADLLTRGIYNQVSGEIVAPLSERNNLSVSIDKTEKYVTDTVTLQKSVPELWDDGSKVVTGFVEPFTAKQPSFVTGTLEEHYNYGHKQFQMVSNASDLIGLAGVAKTVIKKSIKLAPKGKLPGNRTGTTFMGKLATLLTDVAESKAAKAAMKDGKFKTNESALNKLIDELKLSDMLQGKMVTQLKNNLPFKVVTLTTGNGLQMKILVKNPDYQFTSKKIGEGGGKTGESKPKKNSIPDFVKKQWEAGNNFNKENRPRYPYNEIELEAIEGNGKKYVVDSYIPGKEIVSRKFTQLAEVQEKTALSYLSEFTKKYSAGSEISTGKFNPNALKGGRLEGELILEVPVQTKPVPQAIIDEANEKGIIIRDITGKEYN